jgi:hypothetical protein
MQIVMTVTLEATDLDGGLPAALRKLAGEVTVSGGETVVSLTLPEIVHTTFGASSALEPATDRTAFTTNADTAASLTRNDVTVSSAPVSLPVPSEASKLLGLELDSAYTPWIEGIHNSNKKLYASGPNIGLWMLGRGIDREAAEPQLRARREQIKAALTSPAAMDYAMAPVNAASTPAPAAELPPFAAASPASPAADIPAFAAQSPQTAAPFTAAPTAALQDWTWPEFLQAMSRCGVTAIQVQEASGLPNFAALASDPTTRSTVAAKLNMTKVGV